MDRKEVEEQEDLSITSLDLEILFSSFRELIGRLDGSEDDEIDCRGDLGWKIQVEFLTLVNCR